jgi:photosystem II stability/assembly factor-like uncharacterized protein
MKVQNLTTTKTTNFRPAAFAAAATFLALSCPAQGLAASATIVYAGSFAGILKSTNGGQSWTNISPSGGFPQSFGEVTAIAIDPTNTMVIDGGGGFISKTTDGGSRWSNMSNGLAPQPASDITTIVIDPSNTATVYVGAGVLAGGLYKSTNSGSHWKNIDSNVPLIPPPPPSGSAPILDVRALAIDPLHTQTLYLTGQTGTYTSSGSLLRTPE